MGGHLCNQMGKRAVKVGAKEEDKGTGTGKKWRKMALWPPFQGKGGLETIFQGFQHTAFSLE